MPPTTAIDTHTVTIKRDSLHPFPQNTILTRLLKMAFNDPSSSKDVTGVITNHRDATLPGLQPEHDGDSLKQETPAKSTQIVTTNAVRQTTHAPDPNNRSSTSARNLS